MPCPYREHLSRAPDWKSPGNPNNVAPESEFFLCKDDKEEKKLFKCSDWEEPETGCLYLHSSALCELNEKQAARKQRTWLKLTCCHYSPLYAAVKTPTPSEKSYWRVFLSAFQAKFSHIRPVLIPVRTYIFFKTILHRFKHFHWPISVFVCFQKQFILNFDAIFKPIEAKRRQNSILLYLWNSKDKWLDISGKHLLTWSEDWYSCVCIRDWSQQLVDLLSRGKTFGQVLPG